MKTGLVATTQLEAGDLFRLRKLAEICNRADGVEIKLNWGMIGDRQQGRVNDYCYYQNGDLVGYLPVDDFGGAYEITGLVDPAHRGRGIFRGMFDAARQELSHRGASQLLLVNYRASEAGCAVVKRLGLSYSFSEYCMEAATEDIPPTRGAALRLETATPANINVLSQMLQLTFENSRLSAPDALLRELDNPEKGYYIARLDDEPIGQIGIITTGDGVYIRAVGIVPSQRGKGYGRQLLAAAVQRALKEGARRFELDVATENAQALSLYTSCGFRETKVYDYYSVPLTAQ